MKQKSLLLVALLFSILCLKAQEAIELDFSISSNLETQLEKYEPFVFGKEYQIVILNINKNIFSVGDSASQKEINTDVPSIFKGVKLPSFLSLNEKVKSDSEGDTISLNSDGESNNTVDSLLIKADAQIKQIMLLIDKIQAVDLLNYSIHQKVRSCDKTGKEINDEVKTVLDNYMGTNQSSYGIEQFRKFELFYLNLLAELKKQKVALASIVDLKIDELKTRQSPIENLIVELEYVLEIKKSKTLKNFKKYKSSISEVNAIKAEIKKIKETQSKIEKIIDGVLNAENLTSISEVRKNYALANTSNFTYYGKPFKVTKDETTISINITPKENLICMIDPNLSFDKDIPTKGGLKIDFSTGLFLMGGSDDFLGREAQYVQVEEGVSVIQAKDGGNRRLLGVGGLMHLYKRSTKNVNIALSPGLSTTTGFDNLNFHLGLSLLAGRKNRLVFTGGLVLRESQILDKNYRFDTRYNTTELPETPPIINVFPKSGWFFSLTYNLSTFKSE